MLYIVAKKEKAMKNILIDTSLLLEDSESIEKIVSLEKDKKVNIFITDIIMQEMDGHKKNSGHTGYVAREFFRVLGKGEIKEIKNLPTHDIGIKKGDSVVKMVYKNISLFVINRNFYRSRDNDLKIIEIAKDYNLFLYTQDMAQKVRAIGSGAKAIRIIVDSKKNNKFALFKYFVIIPLIMTLSSFAFNFQIGIISGIFALTLLLEEDHQGGRKENSSSGNNYHKKKFNDESDKSSFFNDLSENDYISDPGFSTSPSNTFHS